MITYAAAGRRQQKAPRILSGGPSFYLIYRLISIAGAGFEPATFGL